MIARSLGQRARVLPLVRSDSAYHRVLNPFSQPRSSNVRCGGTHSHPVGRVQRQKGRGSFSGIDVTARTARGHGMGRSAFSRWVPSSNAMRVSLDRLCGNIGGQPGLSTSRSQFRQWSDSIRRPRSVETMCGRTTPSDGGPSSERFLGCRFVAGCL